MSASDRSPPTPGEASLSVVRHGRMPTQNRNRPNCCGADSIEAARRTTVSPMPKGMHRRLAQGGIQDRSRAESQNRPDREGASGARDVTRQICLRARANQEAHTLQHVADALEPASAGDGSSPPGYDGCSPNIPGRRVPPPRFFLFVSLRRDRGAPSGTRRSPPSSSRGPSRSECARRRRKAVHRRSTSRRSTESRSPPRSRSWDRENQNRR